MTSRDNVDDGPLPRDAENRWIVSHILHRHHHGRRIRKEITIHTSVSSTSAKGHRHGHWIRVRIHLRISGPKLEIGMIRTHHPAKFFVCNPTKNLRNRE